MQDHSLSLAKPTEGLLSQKIGASLIAAALLCAIIAAFGQGETQSVLFFGLIIVSTVVFVLNRFRLYNPSKNILILLIVITFIYSIPDQNSKMIVFWTHIQLQEIIKDK